MGSIDELSAQPPPRPERLDWFEATFKVRLPDAYRQLVQWFNGARAVHGEISADGEDRTVGREG